ncbi:hypothetical protein K6L09_20595 [Burkholderia cepacia]
MKNGQYKQITDIGLGKNINSMFFKHMNQLEDYMKKKKSFTVPFAIIINGDSKILAHIDGMSKEEYVDALKITCSFMDAEAIMIFSIASMWTGTQEEWHQTMNCKGSIHGHSKSKNILVVAIETQGKQIIGRAEIEYKNGKQDIKAMEWVVQDIPDSDAPDSPLFSNFLTKQKEAA